MREDPIEWTPEELRRIERQNERIAKVGESLQRAMIENELHFGLATGQEQDNTLTGDKNVKSA